MSAERQRQIDNVRLERLCQCNCKQSATEQGEARQARLTQSREANPCRGQAGRQPGPEQTSMPTLEDEWVQDKLACFLPKCQTCLSVIVAVAMNHSLASGLPQAAMSVATDHVTSNSLNSINFSCKQNGPRFSATSTARLNNNNYGLH